MLRKFVSATLTREIGKNQANKVCHNVVRAIHLTPSAASQAANQTPMITVPDVKESVEKFVKTGLTDEYFKRIFEPQTLLSTRKYESIYPGYIESMNHWTNCTKEQCKFVLDMTNLLFDQMALADDLIDQSAMRYGELSPYHVYGFERTLLCSVAILLECVRKMNTLGDPEAVEAFCKDTLGMYVSMYWQMDSVFTYSCPTLREGIFIGTGKGGPYYVFMMELLQSLSPVKDEKNFKKLGLLMGLFHQLVNDSVNLVRDKDTFLNDKEFAEDITAGQFSLPLVIAAQKDSPRKDIVLNILRQKTSDPKLKSICVDLIEEMGCMEDAKHMESIVYDLIMEQIDLLGGNPKLVAMIDTHRTWRTDKLTHDNTAYDRHREAELQKARAV